MKTKEVETYRINGKPIVTLHKCESTVFNEFNLFALHSVILNKKEIEELVCWLINKSDEEI